MKRPFGDHLKNMLNSNSWPPKWDLFPSNSLRSSYTTTLKPALSLLLLKAIHCFPDVHVGIVPLAVLYGTLDV